MNWPRPCAPRLSLIDEIPLTEAQWGAYLKTLHAHVAETLQAVALALEERQVT